MQVLDESSFKRNCSFKLTYESQSEPRAERKGEMRNRGQETCVILVYDADSESCADCEEST